MTFSRFTGASAVLLAAAALAHPQPPAAEWEAPAPREVKPAVSMPPLGDLLRFVNDPAFRAELKLSPDQVKQLLDLRQRDWDDEYNTVPKERLAKRAEREAAFTEAFRKILTDDQFRRARQLALQDVWSHGGFSTSFATPEVGTDLTQVNAAVLEDRGLARLLNLSETQKRLADLAGDHPSLMTIRLTADQTAVARDLLGPLCPRRWQSSEYDPRMSDYYTVAHSDTFSPARLAKTHRAELKLTDQQAAAILEPKSVIRSTYSDEISPAEALRRAKAADADSEKALAAILTPEQMARLRLIARQSHRGRFRVWPFGALADELKATPEQRRKFAALRAAHAEALGRAIALDDFAAAYRGVLTANAELDQRLRDALTEGQRAELTGLVGDPLTRQVRRRSVALTDAVLEEREASFGRYADELSGLSRDVAIWQELKLTRDQRDLTSKSVAEQTKRFGSRIGKAPREDEAVRAAEKSKFIGEALASILDAEQTKRFREIMIQRRERGELLGLRARSTELRCGLTYPGVAEELRLSAEQKRRLAGDEHPVAVLTGEQWKAYRELRGERFVEDLLPSGNELLQALEREPHDRAEFLSVIPWAVLKLRPDEQTRLAEACNRYRLDMELKGVGLPVHPGTEGLWTPETKVAIAKIARAFDRDLDAALESEGSRARLDQLMLQSRAADNLLDALTQRRFFTRLHLTPGQLSRIADLEDEVADLAELVSANLGYDVGEDFHRRLRDRLDARTFALFTPEQHEQWKELTGDPLPGLQRRPIWGPIFRIRSRPASTNPWGVP